MPLQNKNKSDWPFNFIQSALTISLTSFLNPIIFPVVFGNVILVTSNLSDSQLLSGIFGYVHYHSSFRIHQNYQCVYIYIYIYIYIHTHIYGIGIFLFKSWPCVTSYMWLRHLVNTYNNELSHWYQYMKAQQFH